MGRRLPAHLQLCMQRENEEVFIIDNHIQRMHGVDAEENAQVVLDDFIHDQHQDDHQEQFEGKEPVEDDYKEEERQDPSLDGPANRTRLRSRGEAGRQYSIIGLQSLASGRPSAPDPVVDVAEVEQEIQDAHEMATSATSEINISDDFKKMKRKEVLAGPLRTEFLHGSRAARNGLYSQT